MGILALIAEFENDIRRERQMDRIKKAKAALEVVQKIKELRAAVPEIMRRTKLSKASVYRALNA
jgi:DNA invertase Pin-like site-specific DNA recombinase